MRRTGEADYMQIVIIGGGISGLSSAFYLQREAERQGKKASLTIVDGAPDLGGKIKTLHRDGFVIERGPDSFLSRKLPTIELALDLGIESELTAQNSSGKTAFIMKDGKLHPMPKGLVLGVPTDIDAFLASGLVSEEGKQRALLDLELPGDAPEGDESLGGFLSRRVGAEIVKHVTEPLLAGIYAGDLSKLSIQSTFPQFAEAEREHGSLIRGTIEQQKKGKAAQQSLPEGVPAELNGSMFLSFKNGLSTLVDALDKALGSASRKLGVKVSAIEKTEAAAEQARYSVVLENGERLPADSVIVTSQSYHTAELLAPHMDVATLRDIQYVSVANVVMAFEKEGFGVDFAGSGFLVPRSEGLRITACTWTSTKWLHTSPGDKVLLRCYVGRAGDEGAAMLPDEELKQAVLEDIHRSMGITAEPIFTEITRLPRSMPQYPVGHLDHIEKLRETMAAELPGVYAIGAAFHGVGLPDCIRQGKEAAIAVMKSVQQA